MRADTVLELKRQMVWLSGLLPYAQAEAVLERIGKRTISDSSLWRAVERQGDRLTVEPTEPVAAPAGPDQPWPWGKMLSMDGGMVNIRQEGWKELKVGLIGNVVSDDPPDSSVIPEVHTVPVVYTAVLGDVEAFAPVLVRAAQYSGGWGGLDLGDRRPPLPPEYPNRGLVSRPRVSG